jgi:hypothetical protein
MQEAPVFSHWAAAVDADAVAATQPNNTAASPDLMIPPRPEH